MFVLLYPNQACAGMHQRFAEEYRKAPGELNVDLADRRRPMGRVKDKGCAAVA